ncbi:MAG: hypothetical protein RR942_06640 [Romboutsia sp.]
MNGRKYGLTFREGIVMDNLVEAYNNFLQLGDTHPCEKEYFVDGIHNCQQQLMNRVLRRDYPVGYPTYNEKSDGVTNETSRLFNEQEFESGLFENGHSTELVRGFFS